MEELKEMYDYTLLDPYATEQSVSQFLSDAHEQAYRCAIIPPYYVPYVREEVEKRKLDMKLGTVIGFPYGFSSHACKFEELRELLVEEVDELDIVLNHHAIVMRKRSYVEKEIDSYSSKCRLHSKTVKLIVETSVLDEETIAWVADIMKNHDVDYFETGTGENGATRTETIELLKGILGETIGIKALGGMCTAEDVMEMYNCGATRIGGRTKITF